MERVRTFARGSQTVPEIESLEHMIGAATAEFDRLQTGADRHQLYAEIWYYDKYFLCNERRVYPYQNLTLKAILNCFNFTYISKFLGPIESKT
jgi:hypothetical protein